MIHFSDLPGKENSELLPADEYKDIKSQGGISKAEAKDFWNDVFEDESGLFENELSEGELLSEIFGRNEDEFDFDFEIDKNVREILDEFEEGKWNNLDESEQKDLIKELASTISEKLELDEKPEITFYDGPENSYGAYNPGCNSVEINSKNFQNPIEVIDTVVHELRHAYQYQRADKLETMEDMLYKVNLDNYISPISLENGKYLFFTDYQDQLVEAEARAFANLFRN